jgi:hypothetical protein
VAVKYLFKSYLVLNNGSTARGASSHREGCKIQWQFGASLRAKRMDWKKGQGATIGSNNPKQ